MAGYIFRWFIIKCKSNGWGSVFIFYFGIVGVVVDFDRDSFLKNVLEYKNDEMGNKNFGNWVNQVDILDSYKDNLGSERIGQYLNILLKGFKNKLSSFESISIANSEFSKSWGQDKILK